MTAQSKPLWRRISAALATAIVRTWPPEIRDWGSAFAAELHEIENPFSAFRWLLGGLMLVTRERFKYFLRSFGRPVGVPAGSSLELNRKLSGRVPRTPRIVTFILLLATAGILLHPEVRTSLRTTIRSYVNPDENTSRWYSVRQLRKEVAVSHDPKLLALLSLVSTDEAESSRLSDEAIARDASFTWLDFENAHPNSNPWHPIGAPNIKRLQAWDPDNAVVWLLSAEITFESHLAKSIPGIATDTERNIPDSPYRAEWAAGMSRAFEAAKYDNYSNNVAQLIREVSGSHSKLDPDITAYILPKERIPNLLNIRTYGDWLLLEGKKAEQRGEFSTARKDYWQVMRFGGMMRQRNVFPVEWLIGVALGKHATGMLQPLLEKTGRAQEAQILGLQMTEWDTTVGSAAWSNRWFTLEWSGFTIQLVSILFLILAIISVLSFLVLLATHRTSPRKRTSLFVFACWSVDAGPLGLLLCGTALFFLYHPFAQTYNRFIFSPNLTPDLQELQEALFVTHFSLASGFDRSASTFHFWIAITSGLILLMVSVITHMVLRRQSSRDLVAPSG